MCYPREIVLKPWPYPNNGSPYANGSYAIIPVGTEYRDGTWQELNRDLDADLQSVFGVGVEYVKWFCIRGKLPGY